MKKNLFPKCFSFMEVAFFPLTFWFLSPFLLSCLTGLCVVPGDSHIALQFLFTLINGCFCCMFVFFSWMPYSSERGSYNLSLQMTSIYFQTPVTGNVFGLHFESFIMHYIIVYYIVFKGECLHLF